jgi:two-component system phosphate regulon sensor histidine kinase PhoR
MAARKTWEGRDGAPEIRVQLETAALLYGNSTQLESVVGNLLSNAVRHTPQDGSITMTWRASKKGAEIVVQDTGEGIAAEHIPRLTERFFRVDRGRSRDDGGVGLGLAIVKHILNRHDGELHISSEPGVGSEFHCRFPAQRVAAPEPVAVGGSGS